MRHLLAVLALVCLAACFTGPSVNTFIPAQTGHGITGVLQLASGGDVEGELLEMRDTAYVFINTRGVIIVPFDAIRGARFDALGWVGGGRPRADSYDQLQLSSRFPHGMSEATLADVLASTGRSEMTYVR